MVDYSKVQFSDAALELLEKNETSKSQVDFSSVEFSEDAKNVFGEILDRRSARLKGLAIEFGEGALWFAW